MEFYRVQIPYRGIVPLLNRKGPIACVELTRDQVNLLKDYGVEMLDPDNGKAFRFPEEKPIVVTLKDFENAHPITMKELEDQSKKDEPEAQTTSENNGIANNEMNEASAENHTETADAPIVESGVSVDTDDTATNAAADNAETENKEETREAESDVIIEVPEFAFERIAGYSALTKKKKRELRAYFAESVKDGCTEEDLNKIYEVLNSMAHN